MHTGRETRHGDDRPNAASLAEVPQDHGEVVSVEHYRLGVEASPTGLLMVDCSGRICMVNRQLEAMFGYDRSELLGAQVELLIPERYRAGHPELMQRFLKAPSTRFMGQGRDLFGVRKDGTELAIEIGLNPSRQGNADYVLASIVDVSERKQNEAELRERVTELQRYQAEMGLLTEMSSLLQHAISPSEALVVVAGFGERLLPCEKATSSVSVYLTRASGDGLERQAHWGDGEPAARFASEECWGLRRSQVHFSGPQGASPSFPRCSHAKGGAWHMCIPMAAHGQAIGLISMEGRSSLSPTARAGRERVGRAIADQLALAVSNLDLRESLSALAVKDPLTSLFNRRHMEASVTREIARAKREGSRVSILMLDVDEFKAFNDTHGHQAADQALVELGSRMNAHFRESDIACRYGGEEFLVVLPNCPKQDGHVRAEKFRRAVCGMGTHGISVSIGVAEYPEDGHNWETVLRKADGALYEAKAAGRNRVHVASSPLRLSRPNESVRLASSK